MAEKKEISIRWVKAGGKGPIVYHSKDIKNFQYVIADVTRIFKKPSERKPKEIWGVTRVPLFGKNKYVSIPLKDAKSLEEAKEIAQKDLATRRKK